MAHSGTARRCCPIQWKFLDLLPLTQPAAARRARRRHVTAAASSERRPSQRRQHLGGGTLAGRDRTVEVALEVLGGVLAAEVHRSFDLGLGRAERLVLPDPVVGVRAEGPRVGRPGVERSAPIPPCGDPRQHRLKLGEEGPGARLGAARHRGAGASQVVDKDPGCAGLRARDLPRRLVPRIGVGVAVTAERPPVPAGEAHVELGVRPHAQLSDRPRLDVAEAGLRPVHLGAEDGEWQREHHAVGGHDASADRQLVARARAADGRERCSRGDLPVEPPGELGDDLVVAPAHVELLVGVPEQAQLALADVPEQVQQVESALVGARGAVLDVVGDVEQLAELGRPAAGDARVDPPGDAHVVQRPPGFRRDEVRGRVRGARDVGVEGLIDAVEVVRRVVVRVRRAVEVVQRLRSVLLGLEQVVEGQPQLLAEVLDVEMVAVYELAAVLRDLSVCEHSPDRPAPPAEPVRGLVDVRQHTCLTEPVGGREPRESRADHDDLAGRRPAGRSRSARRAEREPDGGGTCGAEELAAGRVRVRGDVLEAGSERCAGHGSTITQLRSDTF